MEKICFATGNLYRFVQKKNILSIISKLDIYGIEYTFGKDIYERPISASDSKILKNYSFLSFHWPFKLSLKHFSEKELFSQKEIIESYYFKLKTKQIVVHPGLPFPKKLFNKTKMSIISENLNVTKYNPNRSQFEFEEVLRKNPDYGLCMDVSHCYSWGIDETSRIISKWKKRIKEVHLSNNRYGRDHRSFEKVSKDFLKSIEPLHELDVPIVIEEDMRSCSVKYIKDEVKRIKKMLD